MLRSRTIILSVSKWHKGGLAQHSMGCTKGSRLLDPSRQDELRGAGRTIGKIIVGTRHVSWCGVSVWCLDTNQGERGGPQGDQI